MFQIHLGGLGIMGRLRLWLWLFSLGFALPVSAQIVPNGLGTQVNQNGQQFDITGGTRAGANLFHSFSRFGLSQSQIANFLSNPAIRNILARVTGGDVSVINGLIKLTGGNSNLYLMNPAGIVFGPNASLNVPAAFHATTANGIKIGDGYFGMNTTAAELALLTAEPNGYAFSSLNQNLNPGTTAGVIVNQGNLAVNAGQMIVLAGNQVINTGTIQSPNGTVIISATADGKYVNVSQSGNILSLDLPVAVNQNLAVDNLRPVLALDIPQLLTGTAYVSGTITTASEIKNPNSLINITGERVILDKANLDNLGTDGLIQIRVAPGITNEGYVFLDRVRNYEQLVNNLTPGSELYLINRSDSGVEKVNQVVARNGAVERIDIVGDGNAGQMWFGRDFITLDTLPQYAAQIEQWGQGLTGSRGIYLYACNLAASLAGQQLVGEIGQLTNANIAASTDITGSSQYGGNWEFEYSTGNGLGQIAFDAQGVQTADVKLVTFTVTDLGDTGAAGQLRDAINQANTTPGVDDIVFTPNGTITLALGELVINDGTGAGLTITGNGVGNTIIDGNNASRVFNVLAGATTFNDLTIQNGKTKQSGGGIAALTVTLNNAKVSNNAAGTFGGGIQGSDVILNNSTVSNNKAGFDGGGISANGTLTLTNSTVSDNKAGREGGGIRAGITVTLTDSLVSDNIAGENGGGIFSGKNVILTNNSTVSGNTAGFNGGGIFASGTVDLTNSTVSKNEATSSGGGIRAGSTVTLKNSTVSGNTADDFGGGIFTKGTVTLTDSKVLNNTATNEEGGGIFAEQSVTLTNSEVSGNEASNFSLGNGGGIFSNSSVTVTDSKVLNNKAKNDGGGIFARGAVTLTNADVSDNTAITIGGGVFTEKNITVTNSTVLRNEAGAFGGGIRASGTVDLTDSQVSSNKATNGDGGGIQAGSTVTVKNSTLSGNTADDFGGGIFTKGTVTLTDSKVLNNTATNEEGGGIFAEQSVTLTNSTVSGNEASRLSLGNGGGIASNSSVTVTDSKVLNNKAKNDGGGIFARGAVTLINADVSDNTAITIGGGVFTEKNLTVTNSTVLRNEAGAFGGGIFASGTVDLTDSQVSNNKATNGEGGGIRTGVGTVTLKNSTVSNNTASNGGGGIFANGTLTLENSTVSGNTTTFGSGGGILASGTLTLTNSKVSGNEAGFNGGGIFAVGDVTLTNSTVSENTASDGAGGIRTGGNLTLTNSTVSDNTARLAGGGIFAVGDNLTLTNSTVSNNRLVGSLSLGGGIYAKGKVTLKDSTVSGNGASIGGGIFAEFNTNLTLTNSTVSNNSAFGGGGGIAATGSGITLTLTNSTVSNNRAILGGGIATGIGNTLTLTNSTVSNNFASDLGGGIFANGNVTLTNVTIAFNSASQGGGIFNNNDPSNPITNPINIGNSIVAKNTATKSQPDIGSFSIGDGYTNAGNNLIGNNTGFTGTFTDGVNGTITGVDPLLGTLQNNGGLTQTHALLTGSPALNAGDNALIPGGVTTDQRGTGFDRVVGGTVDIGAYEVGYALTVNGGSPQSTVVNTDFGTPLSAKLIDPATSLPIQGVTITFNTPNTGASGLFGVLNNTTAITNSSGIATASTLTANTKAGTYNAEGSITGITPVFFNLTNNPDVLATLTITGGNNQSTTVNTNFANPLQVTATDQFGNAIPNQNLTFNAPTTGASATTTLAPITTDSTGSVSVPVTANTVSGSYTASLLSGAIQADFNLTNNPDILSQLIITGGNNQSTTVNTSFANSLQVTATDQFGNAIPNQNLTFNAPTTGASATTTLAPITTDSTGNVSVPVTANAVSGSYTASLLSGAIQADFNLTNNLAPVPPVLINPVDISVPIESLLFSDQINTILQGTEDLVFSQFILCSPNEGFAQCLDSTIFTTGEMILQIE